MRLIKKLILSLFVLLLLGSATGIGIAHFYQDEIEQLVVQNINDQLRTPIEVEDIELSLIKKFPYASLELKNFMTLDAYQKDTLLKAEKIFLKINALDLYNKSYTLQQLELHNGFARISFNIKGVPNYQIWHSKRDSSLDRSLDLNHISLNKIHIEYSDAKSNLHISAQALQTELNGTIENGIFSAQINGDFETDFINVSQDKYLEDKILSTWVSLDVSKQRSTFNGSAKTNDLELKFNGNVKNGYTVNVRGTEIDIKTSLQYVPKKFLSSIESFEFGGTADLNIKVENQNISKLPPAIHADFNIKNGSMQSNLPWQIKATELEGIYHNGEQKNNISSIVSLQSINCQVNGKDLNGSLTYSNFNNPYIQAQFNTELNLAEVQQLDYELPLKELSGSAKITANYKGRLGFKNDIVKDFEQAEKSATIQLINTSFQYKPLALFHSLEGSIKLLNNRLEIDSLKGSTGKESKLKFVGAIEHLFSQKKELKVTGHLSSDWLKISEMIIPETNQESTPFIMPKNILANITTSIKDASYKKFHMSNFQAKTSFSKGVLTAKEVQLNSMSGDITGELALSQTKEGNLRLITTSKLEQINVRQLFYEFENFGQTTMRHKHLRGKTTTDIYLRTEWDNYLNHIPENLYAFFDVKINNGELIEFEPMLLMSDYISVNELKRIRFSTLENQIEVKNRSVEIPFMEIHSSAMDIAGSGTHFFDNTLDYEIEFSLNEVMGKRWRKNNKKQITEFGQIENDGVKGTIIPLKMTGTVDDPKISFNFNRAKQSVNEGIEKQKQEIKDAFRQEFDRENNSNLDLEKTPDYNNIIEWEDDEHLF